MVVEDTTCEQIRNQASFFGRCWHVGIVLKDSIGFCMISTYLQVCIMQICHGLVLYAEMSLVT